MIKKPTRVEFTENFKRQRKNAPPHIRIAFIDTLELFGEDPNHPQLRNHALKEKYSGFRSIDVTDDWRALFKIREAENYIVITFHILGTHVQLYG